MLWTSISHVAWAVINVGILGVALSCSAHREPSDLLIRNIQPPDDYLFSEVQSDTVENISTEGIRIVMAST